MTKEDCVLGTFEKVTEHSKSRKCHKCGKIIWFHDRWDFKKVNAICLECIEEIENPEYIITENTMKNVLKELEKREMNKIYKYVG